MPSFAEIANRIYRKVIGADNTLQTDSHGITTTLNGSVAVATVESILSEAAACGEAFPPEKGSIAWRNEQQRQQVNLFGKPLLNIESGSARGALSAAMGLAMAGKRASCSLWSSDLANAQDLVRRAVGHHLPLVIHATSKALPLNGESHEDSDEGIHQLRDSGAFILYAQNVQEAIDFTLIARAVAEKALVPGIVIMDGHETASSPQQIELPSPELIENLVGNYADSIPVAEPAQQLVFGEERRRVPNWYSLDNPTLQGSYRDPYSFGLGTISHTKFFGALVQEILQDTFTGFAQLTGRNYSAVTYLGKKRAKKIIVCYGSITGRCNNISNQLKEIAVASIHLLAPFPAKTLHETLQNCSEAIILDRSESLLDEKPQLYREVLPLLSHNCKANSVIYGVGGLPVHDSDLVAAFKAPHHDDAIRVGVTPLPNNSNPKQQVLTDLLERNYPELGELGITGGRENNSHPSTPSNSQHTPMAVRHLGSDQDSGYQNLSRFWDQTGVLYRDGMESNQGIDPFAAVGHIPPLTSTFITTGCNTLPLLNPEQCTGCGKCWSNCPDSAIVAVSLSPTQLLEAGIKMGGADALRPHLSKLAKQMSLTINSGEAKELLEKSWDELMTHSPLPDERRTSAEDAISQLASNIGELPLIHTEPLFHHPERLKAQSGELLSIVVNPDSCKGCGICAELCKTESDTPALTMQEQSDEELDHAYKSWRVWEQLPDSSSTTIIDYGARPEISTLNATMLSRHASMAMAGGDSAEPGSGEKIAIRQLLGITEYHQQPMVHRLLENIDETHQKLLSGIREKLAVASHADDLSSLAEGLESVSSRQIDLSALAEKTANIESDGVNAEELKEWINLAERIRTERERIASGEHSLGRSRYSMVFAPGTAAAWAGTFPSNPFQVPVVIGSAGEVGALASGLIEGQLEQATEIHRILRKAKLLLKNGSLAERKATEQLVWGDLSRDELQQSPPLLLIGNDTTLGAESAGELIWLLNSRLPIKVIVLAEMDLGFSDTHSDARSELALTALSQRNAYVAQSSIAAPDHLNRVVRESLRHSGPALLRIYVPSPQRHGFNPEATIRQAELALNGHATPLFSYNPTADGVFGTRISLEGNPTESRSIAEWAISEERFSGQFTSLSNGQKSKAVELEEWLKLDTRAQNNKIPVFEEHAINPGFASRLGQLLEQWQMLQELAGIVTPFTEQVKREAESNISADHQREIDELNREHQEELQTLRNRLESEITQRITDQLVALTDSQSDPDQ
ncbi:MAG: 4Fe-4S binding protein [Gammaproteobacteria bacterium]|uniref:4Fe-4S binding protein n=1 Tax=Candidatus Thiopontia autotrophica TaxID=2841688 RepID=A0A8J6PCI0_9GAMM|nr:4Fe-4S binding protein [Candidatus Thiopontia autotrophica]MBL6968663.1 4Fe-4S binding protein [Gammaproteobacteria bacterium]